MEEKNVATWKEFIRELDRIRKRCNSSSEYLRDGPLLFRGQGSSRWPLDTTLERTWPRLLYKDYYRTIAKLKPQIESLVGGNWTIPSYPEIERLVTAYQEFDEIMWAGDRPAYAYMAYLRHHGFPSPLLDWTRSPYVAAYFAFADARVDRDSKVSIFVFCERRNRVSGNLLPVVYNLGPYVKTHRRHVLQQSQYTICLRFDNEWRFESYDAVFEEGPRQQGFCWKFNIPITERTKVLALLDEHNLNAFSLFGSEESLMQTLATRESASTQSRSARSIRRAR